MNANTPTSSPDPQPHAAQVSERAPNQPRPPSNSQSQPDNYRRNEKPSGAKVATAARSGSGTSKNNNVISFTLNWICVVLTVAATIVFGIWAPLSYRATADGNRDNNVVQSSMMQQVMTANDIASSALNSASAQSTVMASMQSRLGAMGQLAILDFCLTQTTVSACSYVLSEVPLTSLVSYLASTTPPNESSASATSTVSAVPTESPVKATSNAQLPVEAVLGIVFGILTVLGLVAGFFVWRNHKRRVGVVILE